MFHGTSTGVLGALIIGISSLAAAQDPASRSADLGACIASANGERRARGCNAVIEAGVDSPADLARAHLNRAGVRVVTGPDGRTTLEYDVDRALADFGEAIRLDSKLVAAYDARARAWQGKGDLDRAIADCDEAIRVQQLETRPHAIPTLHHLFMRRGDVWRDKGALDRALADFEAALAAKPDDYNRGLVILNRGLTYQMMREFDRAVTDFSELISQRWSVPRSYAGRGLVHLQMGNLRQAWDDFGSAIGRSDYRGTPALALHGRGVARGKLGDETGGRADIMAAEAVDERLSRQLAGLGEGLLSGGVEMARARFDHAIRFTPDRYGLALALYGRGAMRNRGGDKAMGGRDQAAAVVLDPDVVKDVAKLGFK
jgi:tetratricopeptide (TPR) repeat protein